MEVTRSVEDLAKDLSNRVGDPTRECRLVECGPIVFVFLSCSLRTQRCVGATESSLGSGQRATASWPPPQGTLALPADSLLQGNGGTLGRV